MPDVPRERLNAQVGKDIIDFTPRIFRAAIPPIVKIKSQRINNAVEIEVSDNGLGMDLKQYGSKLFGFYKRFHNHAEGKGVGLHITKTQLEMMGGRISVESEVNVGSVFKIYLTQFEQ